MWLYASRRGYEKKAWKCVSTVKDNYLEQNPVAFLNLDKGMMYFDTANYQA